MTYVHGFHGNGGDFENSKTWVHLLRWGSTFLWSLVKIASSVSENLVGQVHGEKNNNNNNKKKRCKNNKSPNVKKHMAYEIPMTLPKLNGLWHTHDFT
jgi:hypothetical protein